MMGKNVPSTSFLLKQNNNQGVVNKPGVYTAIQKDLDRLKWDEFNKRNCNIIHLGIKKMRLNSVQGNDLYENISVE